MQVAVAHFVANPEVNHEEDLRVLLHLAEYIYEKKKERRATRYETLISLALYL